MVQILLAIEKIFLFSWNFGIYIIIMNPMDIPSGSISLEMELIEWKITVLHKGFMMNSQYGCKI